MDKFGALVWTGDEGEVRLSAAFVGQPIVTKLDALQDWIFDLQEVYNQLVNLEVRTSQEPDAAGP